MISECFTKNTELVALMLKSHLITAGGTEVGTAIISAISRDDVSHEAALSAILAFQANRWVHGDARAPNVVERRDEGSVTHHPETDPITFAQKLKSQVKKSCKNYAKGGDNGSEGIAFSCCECSWSPSAAGGGRGAEV